jgi:hypothetical protein
MRKDLLLAAHADVDPRSVQRALRDGAQAVRGRAGQRIAEAARELGITLPASGPTEPPSAA